MLSSRLRPTSPENTFASSGSGPAAKPLIALTDVGSPGLPVSRKLSGRSMYAQCSVISGASTPAPAGAPAAPAAAIAMRISAATCSREIAPNSTVEAVCSVPMPLTAGEWIRAEPAVRSASTSAASGNRCASLPTSTAVAPMAQSRSGVTTAASAVIVAAPGIEAAPASSLTATMTGSPMPVIAMEFAPRRRRPTSAASSPDACSTVNSTACSPACSSASMIPCIDFTSGSRMYG